MSAENITVAVGQEFTVSLKSTPTTGYVWEAQNLPPNLVLLGSDYEKPKGAMKPGSPVTQSFRFKAQAPGEYRVTFLRKRSWENQAIETHAVTVTAK
ncbi:MAG TPA: protease inhibitor I42 family protein [Candidatus Acidoferrales bacterium]|nr:protease inhibitor I42 family protein [Candidatus Acidoferrales bacterium]